MILKAIQGTLVAVSYCNSTKVHIHVLVHIVYHSKAHKILMIES